MDNQVVVGFHRGTSTNSTYHFRTLSFQWHLSLLAFLGLPHSLTLTLTMSLLLDYIFALPNRPWLPYHGQRAMTSPCSDAHHVHAPSHASHCTHIVARGSSTVLPQPTHVVSCLLDTAHIVSCLFILPCNIAMCNIVMLCRAVAGCKFNQKLGWSNWRPAFNAPNTVPVSFDPAKSPCAKWVAADD